VRVATEFPSDRWQAWNVRDGPFSVSAKAGSWTPIGGSQPEVLARIIPVQRRLRQPFADGRQRPLALTRLVQTTRLSDRNGATSGRPLWARGAVPHGFPSRLIHRAAAQRLSNELAGTTGCAPVSKPLSLGVGAE
jgi:hypothetical protein